MNAKSIYSVLFMIAMATLAFEVTLSRILSVVSWYHLSFFAISVAMLGMTAGAITVFLWKKDLSVDELVNRVKKACIAFAVSAPVAIAAACYIPLDNGGLQFDAAQAFKNFLIITASISLPFYFSGIAVSGLLTKYPLPVNRLYAADLIGASLGCVVVLIGLSTIDTPSFGFLSGFLGLLAAVLASKTNHKVSVPLLVIIAVATLAFTTTTHIIKPRPVKADGKLGDIAQERWNSFSRIVVSEEQVDKPYLWDAYEPFIENERVAQRFMTIDGLAGTAMRQYRSREDIEHLKYDVTNIAYFLRPTGGAAVIGVGGGKDVQAALYFGHESVLGVELNPIFIDWLQNDFRDFAGIGNNDKVRLVVDEARSYMSHSKEEFELLQMSLIDTWASTGAGAFSLSENGLYTVEAWRTFVSRLSNTGIFTVSRWYNKADPGETGRMLSLAMATLWDLGVSDPEKHIAVVTHNWVATLVLSRSPLTQDDIAKLQLHSAELKHDVAIVPGQKVEHELLAKIMAAKSVSELYEISAAAPLNVSPSTDQNPYFFNMLKIDNLGAISKSREQGVLGGNLLATFTLLMLIGILVVLILPTIILPLWIFTRREGGNTGVKFSAVSFFALIGAGFMCVEIGLLQRLSVFLGHPVYALGVLLFSIIASTGIGSFISEKFALNSRLKLATLSLICVISVGIIHVVLDAIFDTFITYSMPVKILTSIALMMPAGLIMGFFFPTGMAMCKQASEAAAAWFWAINGIFSVLFSALTVFISIFVGIAFNFYLGMFFYALTAVCLVFMYEGEKVPKTQSAKAEPAPEPAV